MLPLQEPAPVQTVIERGSEVRSIDALGDDGPRSQAVAEASASDGVNAAAVRSPHLPPPRVEAAEPIHPPILPSVEVAAAEPTQPVLTPKPQWTPFMPPSPVAGTRHESHISVGRVEVQVNNRSPEVRVVSRPEPVRASRPAPVSLEAHYLDRFFLRP
jgi:hypothetical protein